MCIPTPMMLAQGLLDHTLNKSKEPDKDNKTVTNYYGQPKTEQEDPIVEANKASLKTSSKQTSQTDKAY